ncbi:hypothetical protein J4421_02990 [Candidatus Woesearchaeota archaeon]|nr:hypothetical protein [Candidatus Woesearchaeota archaeon]
MKSVDAIIDQCISTGHAAEKVLDSTIGNEMVVCITDQLQQRATQPADWNVSYKEGIVLVQYAPVVSY